MQQVKNNIGYIILAIAAVVIVVVAWFKATPASAPTVDQPATSTVQRETELPDFAYIEERNGERVLVNERDGYAITLEDNWVPEYYTNVVEIFVRDDYPSGELTASFSYIVNDFFGPTFDDEVNDWLSRYNDNDPYCQDCYKIENKDEVEGNNIVVIKDYGALGDYYIILYKKNEKIFELYTKNISIEMAKRIISTTNIIRI